ncbi:hypothetical protein SUNI508_00409 [Seiridium unicorne]|uniref:Myb-like domain-containing protein n=1 Tax=Seiridium unicorne TaxID=138068 RepID=A0ABR2V7P8_9PEZI
MSTSKSKANTRWTEAEHRDFLVQAIAHLEASGGKIDLNKIAANMGRTAKSLSHMMHSIRLEDNYVNAAHAYAGPPVPPTALGRPRAKQALNFTTAASSLKRKAPASEDADGEEDVDATDDHSFAPQKPKKRQADPKTMRRKTGGLRLAKSQGKVDNDGKSLVPSPPIIPIPPYSEETPSEETPSEETPSEEAWKIARGLTQTAYPNQIYEVNANAFSVAETEHERAIRMIKEEILSGDDSYGEA